MHRTTGNGTAKAALFEISKPTDFECWRSVLSKSGSETNSAEILKFAQTLLLNLSLSSYT